VRQMGIVAAGALHALEHHFPKLHEDHEKAEVFRTLLDDTPHLTVERPDAQLTNLVFFAIDPAWGTAGEFAKQAGEHGVAMFALDPTRVRAVMHRDLTMDQVKEAGRVLQSLVSSR
jgi:threonine aldolase